MEKKDNWISVKSKKKLGYIRDNIVYEGIVTAKPVNRDHPLYVATVWLKWENAFDSAPQLPAIGFPEGLEGLVEYEKKRGKQIHFTDEQQWGEMSSSERDGYFEWFAIPVPDKQPVKPDCAGHKKEVAGVTDMKVLAEMIGDLHYETLSLFLQYFAAKLQKDGFEDMLGGRHRLSKTLLDTSADIVNASIKIDRAFKLSKPFMK